MNTNETIQALRPIDDALFRLMYQDKAACTELLRTVFDDDGLEIIILTMQDDIANLVGARHPAGCSLQNVRRLSA